MRSAPRSRRNRRLRGAGTPSRRRLHAGKFRCSPRLARRDLALRRTNDRVGLESCVPSGITSCAGTGRFGECSRPVTPVCSSPIRCRSRCSRCCSRRGGKRAAARLRCGARANRLAARFRARARRPARFGVARAAARSLRDRRVGLRARRKRSPLARRATAYRIGRRARGALVGPRKRTITRLVDVFASRRRTHV